MAVLLPAVGKFGLFLESTRDRWWVAFSQQSVTHTRVASLTRRKAEMNVISVNEADIRTQKFGA
jgi:hypothetical protein